MIFWFLGLNLSDLLLTFLSLGLGARELNPAMAGLTTFGAGAISYKVGIVSVCGLVLWRLSSRVPLARRGLLTLTVLLAVTVAYQTAGLILYGV